MEVCEIMARKRDLRGGGQEWEREGAARERERHGENEIKEKETITHTHTHTIVREHNSEVTTALCCCASRWYVCVCL